jgi:hypothetical protein
MGNIQVKVISRKQTIREFSHAVPDTTEVKHMKV